MSLRCWSTRSFSVALLIAMSLVAAGQCHAQQAGARIWAATKDVNDVRPGQSVRFGVNVFPGKPLTFQGSATTWTYEWVQSGEDSSEIVTTAQATFRFPTVGNYTITVFIHDGSGGTLQDDLTVRVRTASTPPKPPPPTTKPAASTYHPLQGARIIGPTKLTVGQKGSWEGLPDGGSKTYSYKWLVTKGDGKREGSGSKKAGEPMRLSTGFSSPGTAQIRFTIWDDKTPASKAQVATHTVQIVEKKKPAAASTRDISGWWLWLRPRQATVKGSKQRVVDRVPLILNPINAKGVYTGAYFPELTIKTLAYDRNTLVSKINMKSAGGSSYNYRYKYPNNGSKGGGVMTVSGNRMSGGWQDDGGGASGKWTLERPTAAELKLLRKHFGRG